MSEKIVEIEIFGNKYRICVKGEEDEEYINQLTSYDEQKMQEVAAKSRSSDLSKIAVLTALNLADELFLAEMEVAGLREAFDRLEKELVQLEAQVKNYESDFNPLEKLTP